jgi:NAD-dependent dihydropyrimidine dehydrogenase PreA subunit
MSTSDKSIDIYERLAAALEALPHGFARTSSGVEIKLMKKAFTEEEVRLAGQLTRTPETAAEIAKRLGRDVAEVTALLERLIPLGLVSLPGNTAGGGVLKEEMKGEKKYRLRPFMVGWYEAGMRRLDKEFAELFEQFITEGGGERVFAPRPGLLGVVPHRGTLKPEWIKREPHLDIDAHFKRHERFLVIPCVCRREQEILGDYSCKLPMKRCGFVGLPPQTPLGETVLDREEAMALFAKLEKQGHVHLAFYGFTMFADAPQFMGTCNCCSCCCGIIHGPKLARLDPSTQGPQKSNYRAVVDPEECISCGVCIGRCPVKAIAEDAEDEKDKAKVEQAKCIGCGVCVIGCPTDAIELVPVSAEEWFHVPSSMTEWEERRLEYLAAQK